MCAKPPKCRYLALLNHTSSTSHTYGPVKADLFIGSHPILDILDNPFKFLGRFISKDLSDKQQQAALYKNFNEYMTKVDSIFLSGVPYT